MLILSSNASAKFSSTMNVTGIAFLKKSNVMIVTFNLPVSSASPSTAFVSLTTDCTYPSTSAIASAFPLKSLKKLASILVACFNCPSLPTYGASLYPPVILTFVTS